MAKFTVEDFGSGDFLNLPDDAIVQVEVVSVETRPATNNKTGETWNKENFRFKIVEIPDALQDEYGVLVGSTIFGSVASKLTTHPDNKLRQWSEALLDLGDLDAGFELDTDMLVGRRARAVISSYLKKDGTRNHQVAGLLPLASASIGSSGTPAAADIFGDEPPF